MATKRLTDAFVREVRPPDPETLPQADYWDQGFAEA